MNVLNEQLLETLKCPCCYHHMKGPIFLCLSGHSICSSCWKAKACPVCKLDLTDTRNLCLEAISAVIFYPCNNEENGCEKYFRLDELNEHLRLCYYRSYTCKMGPHCSWKGTRDQLKKHYVDKHDNNILIGKECTCLWKSGKPDYSVYLMLAFDELFYVHAKIRDGIFYWAVQYIGRSEDVILYCFEIQIFTDQFNDRKLEFSEICHDDVKDDINEIIDSGFCVAVPWAVLETYMNMEGVIFFKIEIKRA